MKSGTQVYNKIFGSSYYNRKEEKKVKFCLSEIAHNLQWEFSFHKPFRRKTFKLKKKRRILYLNQSSDRNFSPIQMSLPSQSNVNISILKMVDVGKLDLTSHRQEN